MANVTELTVANFKDTVTSKEVAIVDFWAPWCGYCVRMMPIFEALSEELGDKVVFAKVNTDEVVELAKAKDEENLKVALSKAYQLCDKAVSKGILHKNTASRKKSRLTIAVNKLMAQ